MQYTVAQLIEELRKCNPQKIVVVNCSYDCGFGTAGGSDIEITEDDATVELYEGSC